MSRSFVWITFFLSICCGLIDAYPPCENYDNVCLTDGLSHTINASSPYRYGYYLDYDVSNDPGTHIELAPDGNIREVHLFHNASFSIRGENTVGFFMANGNSSVTMPRGHVVIGQVGDNGTFTMTGGRIYDEDGLTLLNNATFIFSDGIVSDELYMSGTSTCIMSGGMIEGKIQTHDEPTIFLLGGIITDDLILRDQAEATISGGQIEEELRLYNHASCVMSAGTVIAEVQLENSSRLTLSGGIADNDVSVLHDATMLMSGGTINHGLSVAYDATCTVSGGTINEYIGVNRNGLIYLVGSNFAVDGVPLVNGDRLTDFAAYIDDTLYPHWGGTITGTLADGSALDCEFHIYKEGEFAGTCDIIIRPQCDYLLRGDLNDDCIVNLEDFAVIAANWLTDCTADPSSRGCLPK